MNNKTELKNLIKNIEHSENIQNMNGFFGLDGYIDDLYTIVKKRMKNGEVELFNKTSEFSKRIEAAIGKGADNEIIHKCSRAGGNAILTAHCLSKLGVKMKCAGLFGSKEIHLVFRQLNTACDLISIGEPAHTIAFEFSDGKLMFGDLSSLHKVDWETITRKITSAQLQKVFKNCQLIGIVNWAATMHMGSILRHLRDDITSKISKKLLKDKIFFFDVSDIRARNREEFKEYISIIQSIKENSKVIVSLNENEARTSAEMMGIDSKNDLMLLSKELFEIMMVDELVIHTLFYAIGCNLMGQVKIDNVMVEDPKITTGGGDNFNGGLCVAVMMNLPLEQQLLFANSVASFYVTNAVSGTLPEIVEYMKKSNFRELEE